MELTPHRVIINNIASPELAEDMAARIRADGAEDAGMTITVEPQAQPGPRVAHCVIVGNCLEKEIAEAMADRFRRGGAEVMGMTVTVEPEPQEASS